MRKALLIGNAFLQSEKFEGIYGLLREAAQRRGVELAYTDGARLLFNCASSASAPLCGAREADAAALSEADFGLLFGKDAFFGAQLEGRGLRLFNRARAVALCDDKARTHAALARAGLPMPVSIAAPMAFRGLGYTDFSFLQNVEEALGLPYVLKERCGSFGAQVHLVHSRGEAVALLKGMDASPCLFQQYVAAAAGRSLRLCVVGESVRCALVCENAADFRSNLTLGASGKPHRPTAAEEALALAACKALGLDFAGVDLLTGADGAPLLLEVNANLHFQTALDVTGVNLAEDIMEHIEKTLA